MRNNYDAIIIGAGIIGCATAYALAKRGWRTLNVDKLQGSGHGSTGNSCAIIRTYYSTFDGCALAYEGYHYWKNWAEYLNHQDELGMARFHQSGSVVLQTEHNHYLKNILALADKLQIAYEVWNCDTIKKRMPHWDLHRYFPVRRIDDQKFGVPTGEEIAGAVYFPQSGFINDPQLATHNLQRAAESAGANFRFQAEVSKIDTTADRVEGIKLSTGESIYAPVVINIAGPHSAKINALAGVTNDMNIKTRALRHEVVYTPEPPSISEQERMIYSDSDAGVYCRPVSDGSMLVGSEDPQCDQRQWVDPDTFDQDLTDQAKNQVYRAAQRLPDLPIPNQIRGIVDLYDVSDDWIPIYDQSKLKGYYMAIGTSGNQFKNAPPVGEMLAHMICACEAGHDHDAHPLQYQLHYLPQSIDIGFYSRKRTVNKSSSFTVLG